MTARSVLHSSLDMRNVARQAENPGAAGPMPSAGVPRTLKTPLLPGRPHSTDRACATLTVLTGVDAGRRVTLGNGGILIGRAADADLVIGDPAVSSHHARVSRTSEGGFYVEDLESTNGTFVDSRKIDVSPLNTGDRLQLGPNLCIRFALTDPTDESLYQRLYESSTRDPLTHIFNRRYMGDRLVADVAHALRTQGNAAVLIADVDGLKQVNDRYGHLAGDRALCIVAAQILRTIRTGDLLARYGGDEFVILAAGIDRAEAAGLAERVRRAVEELRVGARGENIPITLSIGVALLEELKPTEEPVAALLALADERLYLAKASGRNQVCLSAGTRVHPLHE
jgi:two-component system, cell cycle response regulator